MSKLGVSKEDGVNVAAVGTTQCVIKPHHHHYPAPNPQNPPTGHHVHHVTHPPPPSPSPHLNHQLRYHQITVNINQAGQQLLVPTANYGAQPGSLVGNGEGKVGVPWGTGTTYGGLPLGQFTARKPPGGSAGRQALPHTQASCYLHTLPPQEMGKPTNKYYLAAPRTQQPRNLNHREGQGGTNNQIVGMMRVGGGAGTLSVMYTARMTNQPEAVFPPSHVACLPKETYQQPGFHMNNQLIQFTSAPQKHQTQEQFYYPPDQSHALLTQNLYLYQAGPAPQPGFFYASPTALQGINWSSGITDSADAQHVRSGIYGAQGASMVPQGTLQQTTQQHQPLPQISYNNYNVEYGSSLVPGYCKEYNPYLGYNDGATAGTYSSIKSKKPRGEKAIMDIVDPRKGKNISHEIYNN
ncbi:hypothetical protein M0804_006612 [Polistes exclamans]|nr:hypothetical protein M0804_006612 [Polistes exclamans]